MMLFLTVVLLLLTLYRLIVGNYSKNLMLTIQKKQDEGLDKLSEKEGIKIGLKIIFFLVFSIIYLIIYLIYLINAFHVDLYTYPTLFMLLWMIVSYPIGWMKNKQFNKNKEKYKKYLSKKRTFLGTMGDLITVVYFLYIMMMLVAY